MSGSAGSVGLRYMVKIFRLSFPLGFYLQPNTSLYCVVISTEVDLIVY